MKRPDPVIRKAPSFWTFFKLRAKLWLFKCAIALVGPLVRRRSRKLPANERPTLVKSYPPLPKHEARIFIPQSYKPGDKPLPLLIDIHGGGFCLGAPWVDDRDNCIFAYTHGFCVVSIPYRLGPQVKHPGAFNDIAAMIAAVLADDSLPVDFARVAVLGYSAGGNLALATPQHPSLAGRIAAAVAYFPATNNALTLAQRVARQKPRPDGAPDFLRPMVPMFDVGYVRPDTDRADPRFSPIFAERRDLPRKIFILGCEYDMLCPEAQEMAEDLAQHEDGERVELGQGRVGWKKGNVQWELVEEAEHGFNQVRKRGAEAEKWKKKTIAVHAGVAEWLKKEVYQVE